MYVVIAHPTLSFPTLICLPSINSLRSLAMDLDEGLGSHVEEFARELDDKKSPASNGAGAETEEGYGSFDDEYDDIDDDECDA